MLSTKLKELRAKKDMSQAELAEILGVTQQAVGRWEKDLNMPDYDILKKIAHYFNVTTDYLLGNETSKPKGLLFPLEDKYKVPIIGSVRCGPGGPAYECIDEYISIDDTYGRPEDIRGFRATGDSMDGDGIHDGDICLVHLQDEVEDGQIAVVVLCDGEESEGMIKRVRKDRGMVILQSSNPAYPPRVITGEEANAVHIVGRVVEVRHKY